MLVKLSVKNVQIPPIHQLGLQLVNVLD